MAPPPPSKKPPNPKPPNSPNCPSLCGHHPPSATLDLLIFLLVLFAGAFLVLSYFSYILHSLSLLLPHLRHFFTSNPNSQLVFFAFFAVSSLIFACSIEICCGHRSRRCGRRNCKGLKKAIEFDLQLQGEELLRFGDGSAAVREVNELPWKGGSEGSPDYECLRAELRKMAPVNGRAVLVFRDKCGCPVSKLEGWWPRRGRRHKRSLALTGGGDHR